MKSIHSANVVLDVESAVTARYSAASKAAEPALCCSVSYDRKYLEVLPPELIERDYGCGDPSRHVREGESVLDLGCGGGKICYITSQIVGPTGRVIGIDMNESMLALAQQYREQIGNRIGWHNVEFHRGRIQDLALDLNEFDRHLHKHPVQTADDWLTTQRLADALRRQSPMIAAESIDIVLSNCVLNLVHPRDRHELFAELFRVLKPGGRAVISDIVSSAPVPELLRNDPQLWSGCMSGAFEEPEFLRAFESAGFISLRIVERQREPWSVVEEIEFRSVTVQAFKPVAILSDATGGQVIYRGPWKSVRDDAGFELRRGEAVSCSADVLARLDTEPYSDQVLALNSAGPQSERRDCVDGKCC